MRSRKRSARRLAVDERGTVREEGAVDERGTVREEGAGEDASTSETRDRIRDGLERRGISSAASERLSTRLEVPGSAAPEQLDALLDGAAAAYGAEDATREELTRSLAELGELERLMESFVGELAKLDEALEVLAAYLQRMRSSTGGPGRRVLH